MLYRVTALIEAPDAEEASTLVPGFIEECEPVLEGEEPVDFLLTSAGDGAADFDLDDDADGDFRWVEDEDDDDFDPDAIEDFSYDDDGCDL